MWFGSSGWVEWLGRVVGSSGWVEWLGPVVGSICWVEWLGPVVGSSGWVQWLGRVVGSSGLVELLGPVVGRRESGNEFAASVEGGSFFSISLLLSVYLRFTIFSIYSLSSHFVFYRVFEIKLMCGRVRYELISLIWGRG